MILLSNNRLEILSNELWGEEKVYFFSYCSGIVRYNIKGLQEWQNEQ